LVALAQRSGTGSVIPSVGRGVMGVAMVRRTRVVLLLAVVLAACTGAPNPTPNAPVNRKLPGGLMQAGTLESTGWSIQFPEGWHVQTLPGCANAPNRTGIIVSNVAYRFTNPDGRTPGCEDRLIHPGFPSDGVAIGLDPVGVRIGIFRREGATPFPLSWRQLEVASPGADGPRAFYLGLVVHGAPSFYVRAWIGDTASYAARREAAAVLSSIVVQGEARWKRYEDPGGRFSATIPDDWIVSPAELAGDHQYGAMTTFPVQPLWGACQPPFPVSLVGMRVNDVAISVGPALDGERSTGPRPPRFGPSSVEFRRWNTCQVEGGTLLTGSFTFTDAGAARHVEVGFGGMAAHDGQLARQVWMILNSLRFWPSS
jgi:hypothetical protein